jgi:hypothetical protein
MATHAPSIGIDVHKRYSVCAAQDEQGGAAQCVSSTLKRFIT